MIFNYKIVIFSINSITNVSLAMSKMVLFLDEYNRKYRNYIQITTLSANTKRESNSYGEILVQIIINDIKIKSKFLC